MDLNLVLGAITIAATGFGIWGLVFYRKNGNGKHPPAEPPLAVSESVERDLWQVEKLAEVLQPLAGLPGRMEQAFQYMAEGQMECIQEQRMTEPPPPAWPPEMVPLFERLV